MPHIRPCPHCGVPISIVYQLELEAPEDLYRRSLDWRVRERIENCDSDDEPCRCCQVLAALSVDIYNRFQRNA